MQKFINTKGGFVIIIGILVTYVYGYNFFDTIQIGTETEIITKIFFLLGQIWSNVGIVILAIIIAQHFQSKITKCISLISILLIMATMIIDAIIVTTLNMKFSFFRFYNIIINSGSFFGAENMIDKSVTIFFITSIVLCYISFWGRFIIKKKRHKLYSIVILCGVCTTYFSIGYLHDNKEINNQLRVNPLFVSINDMINYKKNFNAISTETTTGTTNLLEYTSLQGQGKRPNIILVFAESFSPEYSLHNGGLYDYMPKTDKIQKDGLTFSNYMAPGCVSEQAHTSLLQGILPISYGDLFSQDGYSAFAADHDTLPEFFNKQNYKTTFISTAPLKFLNEREYLQKIGYQELIGEEAFEDKKKRAFDAATDEELYKKTEEVISKNEGKPYFLTLQTISSHQPRHSPYGDTIEDTFRYTDDQLGNFYDTLKSKNFFNNGILIIVSDHRIRGKPEQKIIDKIGDTRQSHVMATIVGTGITPNTTNKTIYQAIDFHFGIKTLISTGAVPALSFINNPFDTTTINRDRGIHACKYLDNTIRIIKNNTITPQEQAPKDIQDLLSKYQEYQFKRNILHQSGSTLVSEKSLFGSEWKNKEFLLFGHGGAPAYAPFDSLSGFITAIQQGADGVELDLSYTADGVNAVRHGPHGHEPSDKVKNTCYGRTYIPETTYATLRKECTLENGEKILTFDELLNLTKDYIPLYMVEIKVYNQTKGEEQFKKARTTAKKHNMLDRIIWTSYDPSVRKLIEQQSQGHTAWDIYSMSEIPTTGLFNYDYTMINFNELKNKKNLKTLQALGKPIISYTPLTKSDILFSFGLGISGLLVDDIPFAKQIITQTKTTE